MILLSLILLGICAVVLITRAIVRMPHRRMPDGSPLRARPRDLFVKNPEATTSLENGELLLSLPKQREGLGLNRVAARAWELMDGRTTLGDIAARLAHEFAVSRASAVRETLDLAARLRRGYYAMEAGDWEVAHTHTHEIFLLSAGAPEADLIELRPKPGLIVHACAQAVEPDGVVMSSSLGSPRSRRHRRLAAAFADHVAREQDRARALAAFESAWSHSGAGRLDLAHAAFSDARRLAPGWTNPHYQLGYVCLRQRRYEEALGHFTTAEQMSPGYYMVREYLDLTRKLAAGRLSFEAFHFFERAAAAGPGNPDLAISLCRKALTISPDFPSAHLVLGQAYARKREFDRAERAFARALKAGPDSSTLCNTLFARGSAFMARGMPELAVREFTKVIELDGSPAATRFAMAHLASTSHPH